MRDITFPVIAIEGGIGAGKSTLARWIRAHTEALVTDEATSALMPAYYADPTRWGFAVQVDTITQRARALRSAHTLSSLTPTWLDRSVVGDRAFARANHATQRLSASEYMLYRDLYDALVTYDTELPHAVIYLEVSDDTLAQRRERRGSVGESVPCDYAAALKRAYEEELRDYESRGGLVYRLDWNDDLRDSAPMYAAVTERVLPIYQEIAQLLSSYEINEN